MTATTAFADRTADLRPFDEVIAGIDAGDIQEHLIGKRLLETVAQLRGKERRVMPPIADEDVLRHVRAGARLPLRTWPEERVHGVQFILIDGVSHPWIDTFVHGGTHPSEHVC